MLCRVALVRVRGVKKGRRVDVQLQVDSEGRLTIVGKEIGRKDGGITKEVVELVSSEN